MANIPRIATGAAGPGAPDQFTDLSKPQQLASLNRFLQDLSAVLAGNVSLGGGSNYSGMGNISGQWVIVVSPSVADTEMVIAHGLGRRPVGFVVIRKDKAGDIYESSYQGWTDKQLTLKCSVATVTFSMWVF